MRQIRYAVLAAAALGGAASAHPKLLSTSPAPNAAVSSPVRIALRFSEPLKPAFTGADLLKAGAGRPGKVAATAAVGADGRSLVVTPSAPLPAGRYTVFWHAVASDTHRVAGTLGFSVR